MRRPPKDSPAIEVDSLGESPAEARAKMRATEAAVAEEIRESSPVQVSSPDEAQALGGGFEQPAEREDTVAEEEFTAGTSLVEEKLRNALAANKNQRAQITQLTAELNAAYDKLDELGA